MVLFGRLGTAQEVVQVIMFMLSEEAAFVSDSIHTIDGAWIFGY